MKNNLIRGVLVFSLLSLIGCEVENDEKEIISSELQGFIHVNNLEVLDEDMPNAIKFNSVKDAQQFLDDFRAGIKSIDTFEIPHKANISEKKTNKSSTPVRIDGSTTVTLFRSRIRLTSLKADITYPYCTGDGAIFNDLTGFSIRSYLTGFTLAVTWEPTTEIANYLTSRSVIYTVKGKIKLGLDVEGLPLVISETVSIPNKIISNPEGFGNGSGTCEPPSGGDDGHGGQCPEGSETR